MRRSFKIRGLGVIKSDERGGAEVGATGGVDHQAFADDLSLYVSSTEDANTLLRIVSEFQEWSGLKISIKISLATGALYGKGETQRQKDASAEARKY